MYSHVPPNNRPLTRGCITTFVFSVCTWQVKHYNYYTSIWFYITRYLIGSRKSRARAIKLHISLSSWYFSSYSVIALQYICSWKLIRFRCIINYPCRSVWWAMYCMDVWEFPPPKNHMIFTWGINLHITHNHAINVLYVQVLLNFDV